MLEILFEDSHFIAIHKPPGLAIHRSEMVRDRKTAMAELRNQTGHWVFPVHRLDRATSGIVVFAKSQEDCSALSKVFLEKGVNKRYEAIIRGWMPEQEGVMDEPLAETKESSSLPSETKYRVLSQTEISHSVNPLHPTSRYSWLKLEPVTGRFHQLRKHLRKANHPILGDKQHGDRHHNRFTNETLGCKRMLLAATELSFKHPHTQESVRIERQPSYSFRKVLYQVGLSKADEVATKGLPFELRVGPRAAKKLSEAPATKVCELAPFSMPKSV